MQAERDNGVKIVSSLSRTTVREAIDAGIIGDSSIATAMDTYHTLYGINQ
jgi:hypothetical protein